MRIPFSLRAPRGCVFATLIFSLGLTPSFARMGGSGGAPSARPAFGGGHFSHFAPRGFNRGFEASRFGFDRFGSNRFDHFGFSRFGPNRFGRFGFNRFNRFGLNRFDGNQLVVGGGWGGWGWGAPASTGASAPIIVGGGAPVIINVGADPALDDAGAAYGGGCVVHKLNYDNNGKYVGERQIPRC
jgi:hypothetical protein